MYIFLCLSIVFYFLPVSLLLKESFLLLTLFIAGNILAQPYIPKDKPDKIFYLQTRCEEKLPNDSYILSDGHQKYYLSRYHIDTVCRPGDSLACYAKISPFNTFALPNEFNYSRYLHRKQVYFKIIPHSPLRITGHSTDILSFFHDIRQSLINKTKRFIQDSISCSIINALCLGFRYDLTENTQNLFISTGTIHLLSVSGLHTGAIFMILLFFCKTIGLYGKKINLAVLPLLWIYTCLTGLAPASVRASTILTFIAVGRAFNKDYIPVNSLTAAAFFTLLFRPGLLYTASFLLSYSAYAGILLIFPFFRSACSGWHRSSRSIYATASLSISAQLPTLPVSAYFFHTINLSGFLTNILAIPLATLLLYTSALFLILPEIIAQYFAFIPQMLCQAFICILQLCTRISLNFHHLYPDLLMILLTYPAIIFTVLYFIYWNTRWLKGACLSILLLITWCCLINFRQGRHHEIIIFHLHQHTSVLLDYQGTYSFLKKDTLTTEKIASYTRYYKLKPISPYGFTDKKLLSAHHLIYYKNSVVRILDKNTHKYIPCSTLIITSNLLPQKVFASVLPDAKLPLHIITDGSSTPYVNRQWEKFCKKQKIQFSSTANEGSIRLILK